MIELYHWEPVSHSARVLICLHEIGVDYRSHYVDLLEFEHFRDEFLSMNRNAQVPVLCSDGACLTESSLINEYLAESYPDAGLASFDALGWYRIQTWSKWIDYNLSSSLGTLGTRKYLAPALARGDRAALEEAIARIPVVERRTGWSLALGNDFAEDLVANSRRKLDLVVRRMEQELGGRPWVAGDSYSIADINTFAMIHAFSEIEPDIVNATNAPNTVEWHDRILARGPVRAALAAHRRYPDGPIYAPGPEHSRWG